MATYLWNSSEWQPFKISFRSGVKVMWWSIKYSICFGRGGEEEAGRFAKYFAWNTALPFLVSWHESSWSSHDHHMRVEIKNRMRNTSRWSNWRLKPRTMLPPGTPNTAAINTVHRQEMIPAWDVTDAHAQHFVSNDKLLTTHSESIQNVTLWRAAWNDWCFRSVCSSRNARRSHQ